MKSGFLTGLLGSIVGALILLLVMSAAGWVGAQGNVESTSLNSVSAAPVSATFTYQGQLKIGNAPVSGSSHPGQTTDQRLHYPIP